MKAKTLVGLALVITILMFIVSCGGTSETTPTASPIDTKTQESPIVSPMSDEEKQAAEYEKIAQKALDNEHEHVWVFSHYQERHPHYAEYKCECGATKLQGDEMASFTMTIVGKSEKHPHYMIEECSLCKGHFENENLPTKLEWVISGYQDEHPHLGIIKCTQCDFTYTNPAVTSESAGVSSLITEEATEEHPHYLIVKCTYPECDYTYIEKNATAEYEIETDKDNYESAHPHFLIGECSYEGCNHTERVNSFADWVWDDGICSICGIPKHVSYIKTEDSVMVTGRNDEPSDGNIIIPGMIEGMPVISISPEAFSGNTEIKSVRIPESLKIIGNGAFKDCTELNVLMEDMALYENIVGEIYDSPASQSSVLSVVSAEIIEAEAFKNCTSLETVLFTESVQELHPMAFAACMNLKTIVFMSNHAPAFTPDVLMNVPKELIIYIPIGAMGYDSPEWSQFEIRYYEIQ